MRLVPLLLAALALLAPLASLAAQASDWSLASHATFTVYIGGVQVFGFEGWLYNYTAGPGALLAYDLESHAVGVVETLVSGNSTYYWLVVGPSTSTFTYANDTFIHMRWSVYEAPTCFTAPELDGQNATYIQAWVETLAGNETRVVDNITFVHCYDVVIFAFAMDWGPIYMVYNITPLYEDPWLANITMMYSANLLHQLTPPTITEAYSAILTSVFGAWTLLADYAYTMYQSLNAPPYTLIPYNLSYVFPRQHSISLYCRRLPNGTADVYLVVRGWGLFQWLNVTSTWFNVTARLSTLSFDGVGAKLVYVNETTLVYEWLLQVPSTVYVIRATASYTDVYGVSGSEALQCILVARVSLKVPSDLVTYTPQVSYTICAYDYYTGLPLPGLAIDVYLDSTKLASIVTGGDGCANVEIVLQKPGTYTVRYYWLGGYLAQTTITYISTSTVTTPSQVSVILRSVSVNWSVNLFLPMPTITTPILMILVAAVVALWAWMATNVSVSYATMAVGVVLSVLGVLGGNAGLTAGGAVALVMGALLRKMGY